MAYDRHSQQDVFRLTDKQAPGLMVRARRPGLDAQLLIEEALPVLRRHVGKKLDVRALRAVKKLARALADSVTDWTLMLDGDVAPISARSLGRLDPLFVARLCQSWLSAIERADKQPATAPPATVPVPADPEQEAREELESRLTELPVRAMDPPDLPEEVAASA